MPATLDLSTTHVPETPMDVPKLDTSNGHKTRYPLALAEECDQAEHFIKFWQQRHPDMEIEEVRMLTDCLFHSRRLVAAKYAVVPQTINNLVKKYKETFDALAQVKRDLLANLIYSGVYTGVAKINQQLREVKCRNAKDLAHVGQTLNHLTHVLDRVRFVGGAQDTDKRWSDLASKAKEIAKTLDVNEDGSVKTNEVPDAAERPLDQLDGRDPAGDGEAGQV